MLKAGKQAWDPCHVAPANDLLDAVATLASQQQLLAWSHDVLWVEGSGYRVSWPTEFMG